MERLTCLPLLFRVNAISPGLVPSSIYDVTDPASNIYLAKGTPAGIPGGGTDMVGTAICMCSKEGAFMDGKIVRVDGGRLSVLKGVISNHD